MMKYHLYLNLIFLLALSFFHPAYEWPDADFHYNSYLNGNVWYPLNLFNIEYEKTQLLNNKFNFFSDSYIYKYGDYFDAIALNFNRLIVSAFLILILFNLLKNTRFPLTFNPPLVFSIFAPSQEIFSIVIILAALYFYKKKLLCLLLIFVSLKIDRSMITMVPFVFLFSFSDKFRNFLFVSKKTLFLMLMIFVFLSFFIKPENVFYYFPSDTSFLGLTYEDILYNSQFGSNKYFALVASFFGLYGSMSIRPFAFFIYYPLMVFIFIKCFYKIELFYKNILFFNFLIIVILLWMVPPLSQARYFPIVLIVFWNIIFSLFKKEYYKIIFGIFILIFNSLGLFITFLK